MAGLHAGKSRLVLEVDESASGRAEAEFSVESDGVLFAASLAGETWSGTLTVYTLTDTDEELLLGSTLLHHLDSQLTWVAYPLTLARLKVVLDWTGDCQVKVYAKATTGGVTTPPTSPPELPDPWDTAGLPHELLLQAKLTNLYLSEILGARFRESDLDQGVDE